MSDDFDDLARGESAEFLPESEEAIKQDWRDDPGWRLAWYRAELWSEADAPNQPTAEAELANPPIWASLYDGGQIVATWSRSRAGASSGPSATVVA
jgi:hypothetical protein